MISLITSCKGSVGNKTRKLLSLEARCPVSLGWTDVNPADDAINAALPTDTGQVALTGRIEVVRVVLEQLPEGQQSALTRPAPVCLTLSMVAALVTERGRNGRLRLLMKSPGGQGRPAVGSGPWGAYAGTVSITGLRDVVYPDAHPMLAAVQTDDIAAQLAKLLDRRVYVEVLAVS